MSCGDIKNTNSYFLLFFQYKILFYIVNYLVDNFYENYNESKLKFKRLSISFKLFTFVY